MSEILLKPGIRLKTVWHVNPNAITLNTIAVVTEIKDGRVTLDRGEDTPSRIPFARLQETTKGWILLTQDGKKCAEYQVTEEIPKWLKLKNKIDETESKPNENTVS